MTLKEYIIFDRGLIKIDDILYAYLSKMKYYLERRHPLNTMSLILKMKVLDIMLKS